MEVSETVVVKTDVKIAKVHEKIISYCHPTSNTISPVRDHRSRQRTLMGGIEAMTDWGNYVGTLGLFVQDKSDGQIVALSNNHVFANSQVVASLENPNEQGFTTTLNTLQKRLLKLIWTCTRVCPRGKTTLRALEN